jgi:hypothetical protein
MEETTITAIERCIVNPEEADMLMNDKNNKRFMSPAYKNP